MDSHFISKWKKLVIANNSKKGIKYQLESTRSKDVLNGSTEVLTTLESLTNLVLMDDLFS